MSGTCRCGCGRQTPIANYTRGPLGHVKGQPVPFCRGHNALPKAAERFQKRIEKTEGGCWRWLGALTAQGYGVISDQGKTYLAHRWSYEHHVGPIPEGLQIDHLCRVRSCVNPDHLEPVTQAENFRRGMSPSAIVVRTNTCARGHMDFFVRADGDRECGQCRRDRNVKNRDTDNARRRARRAAA